MIIRRFAATVLAATSLAVLPAAAAAAADRAPPHPAAAAATAAGPTERAPAHHPATTTTTSTYAWAWKWCTFQCDWAWTEWVKNPKPHHYLRVKIQCAAPGVPPAYRTGGWITRLYLNGHRLRSKASCPSAYTLQQAWGQTKPCSTCTITTTRFYPSTARATVLARGPPAAATLTAACHGWNWAKGSRDAKAWWQCNSPPDQKVKIRLRCHYPGTVDYVSGQGIIAVNVASAAACGSDGSLRTVLVGTKTVGTPLYRWHRVWRW